LNAQRDIAIASRLLAEAGKLAHDPEAVKSGYEQAIEIYMHLVEAEPYRYSHRMNISTVAQDYGDYLLVELKDPAAARAQYVTNMTQVLEMKSDKDLVQLEMERWSMGYYRLGMAAAAQKNAAQVKRYFERSALIQDIYLRQRQDRPEAKADSDLLLDPQINLMLTQAWAGQVEPAVIVARALVARFTKDEDALRHAKAADCLVRAAFAIAMAAQHVPETSRESAQREALEALQKAIAAGYKDVAYLESDPDAEALRTIAGFDEILQQLRQ
jgi:hypothetical protein